jgi:hypothetical protein
MLSRSCARVSVAFTEWRRFGLATGCAAVSGLSLAPRRFRVKGHTPMVSCSLRVEGDGFGAWHAGARKRVLC